MEIRTDKVERAEAGKLEWHKPELRKLDAREAQGGGAGSNDGHSGLS
jgi:hypothetical protein